MGLFFKSKKEKEKEELNKALMESARHGRFTCPYCGTVTSVKYYGSNDTYTCRNCGRRNNCR